MDANGVLQNAYDPVYQALRVTSPVAGLYAPTAGSYITTSAESNLSNEKVLGTDISMRGLAADKPAASIAGRTYVETDGAQIVYYDTGSAWFEIARYTGATVPVTTTVTATGVAATDTAAINAAISAAAAGASILLVGAFVTNAALAITSKTDLAIFGAKGSSITNATNTPGFNLTSSSRILIRDLKLVGSDDVAKTANTGIQITLGCADITILRNDISLFGYDGINALDDVDGLIIDGNRVTGCHDDGINPGGGGSTAPIRLVRVTNNIVRSCTHDGIHVSVGTDGCSVTGNVIELCNFGIGLYTAIGATVANNIIRASTNTGIGVHQGPCTDITINGNVIEGGVYGIGLGVSLGCNQVTITGNTISSPSSYGIATFAGNGAVDITVTGNSFYACDRGISVTTTSLRWVIVGNVFSTCTTYGVVFTYGSGTATQVAATIADNLFRTGCATAAILLSACTSVDVHENIFHTIAGDAVKLGAGAGTFAVSDVLVADNRYIAVSGSNLNIGTASVVMVRGRNSQSGIVDESTSTVTISNDNTEQTIVTLATPAALAAGDRMILRCGGELLNNTGGAVTFTFKFKLGATTIITSSAASETSAGTTRKFYAEMVIALTSLTAQVISGFQILGLNGANDLVFSSGSFQGAMYGTAAEDLSTSKNVVVTVTMNTANANAQTTKRSASLERIPKLAAA